jgi:hypothetical protein
MSRSLNHGSVTNPSRRSAPATISRDEWPIVQSYFSLDAW